MSLLDQLNVSLQDRSKLSQETFDDLRAVIEERTGIHFRDNKRYLLESQVGRRLSDLDLPDYEAYLELIQNGGMRRELPLLINAVTINETYFFRHPAQYEGLVHELLPEVLTGNAARTVRLWSAACSNGSEPYTLALLIHEHLRPRFPQTRFEIVGTDINTEVLDQARRGVYRNYAVRNVPKRYMQRYFSQRGEDYVLDSAVRGMVSFREANLADAAGLQRMRQFDVILCANVLIYFDADVKQRVVAGLYNSLRPGGYLLVGNSETLYGVSRAFQPVRLNDTIAYHKGDRHD